ncbi:hypothetical protein GPECTOR_90g535 [Gonium pectorale]|uniref:VASt domain-containing protein n=1 Tax=Gonium pectorale TaxID=33097 RepID=A0A150G0T7_GONPE|nr:hypothetical protein GPECTOR_90g535 [Gonium pectorale]|eukprot:KXZ43448.1 hypothetical protein GPECTOR_90g535 [Gonium pectorale]
MGAWLAMVLTYVCSLGLTYGVVAATRKSWDYVFTSSLLHLILCIAVNQAFPTNWIWWFTMLLASALLTVAAEVTNYWLRDMREIKLSTSTSVTPWSACSRTVRFSMPLRMPDFVKKLVGLDSVAVTEVQRVLWHGAGSFSVSSETAVGGLGTGRFTTALQLSVTELDGPGLGSGPGGPAAPDGEGAALAPGAPGAGPQQSGASTAGTGLQLVYSVRCAASSVPWPMSATIENLMADKALVSMQSFLDFCTQLLEEQAAGLGPVAGARAAAGAGEAADGGSLPATAACAAGGAPATATADGAPHAVAPAPPAAVQRPPSIRHRWPSITCQHDIVAGGAARGGADPWVAASGHGGAAGDPFLLRRQDTLGGGEIYWDAPESFTAGGSGGGSGHSSGIVSPRQAALLSGGGGGVGAALRHLSADQASAPALQHDGAAAGTDAAVGFWLLHPHATGFGQAAALEEREE